MKKIEGNGFATIMKVLFVSYFFTALLLLILAFMTYKIEVIRDKTGIGVIIIYVLANILAGFILAKTKEHKKVIWGIISGLCYFMILAIISIIITKSMFLNVKSVATSILTCITGGIIGGILS